MKVPYRWIVLASVLATASGPVSAHHGTRISYDRENPITLEGTVTELVWANPHVALFVNVEDENGNVVNGALECGAIRSFVRMGMTRTTLAIGPKVTVRISPSRAGAPVGQLEEITLSDNEP